MSHAFTLLRIYLCYNCICKTEKTKTDTGTVYTDPPPNCLTPSTTEVQ